MAGGRTIQFGVTLDTSQAKAQAKELQGILSNVSKVDLNSNFISQELSSAAAAAKTLQTHLQAATDVNTGKLNLNTFMSSLQSAGQSLSQLMSKLQGAGSAGQTAFKAVASAITTAQVPLKQLNGTLGQMWTTLKNTAKWQISSSIIHGLTGALSGAVTYAKQLDSALNDIRIVTGQTVDQMADFTKNAQKAAATLSTTTKEYAKASLLFYQQGLGDDEVAKRTALTIKAANASFGSSAKEMSEYLTAVWNSYQAGSDQLQSYVDVMAALGASTASSMEEIATSLSKVAATANVVGVSMEQMSSIVATVSDVTRQSAESVGTAYKTILARMADLKLGKTLEDQVSLGQVSSSLQKIGVEILTSTGDLRDMGTVIEEIGKKWQGMNKAQQTALAEQMGGKRQYTQLIALFDNMSKYQKNLETAQNSEGSLDKMADTYAESWEAASARVQNALQGIYSQLIDGQGATKVLDTFTGILTIINDMIKSVGGLSGVFNGLGSILTMVFADKIVASMKNMRDNLSAIFKDPKKNMLGTLSSMADTLKIENGSNGSKSMNNLADLATTRSKFLQQSHRMSTQEQTAMEARFSMLEKEIGLQKELEDKQAEASENYKRTNAQVVDALNARKEATKAMQQEVNNASQADKNYGKVLNENGVGTTAKTFDTEKLLALQNNLNKVKVAYDDVSSSMQNLNSKENAGILADQAKRTDIFATNLERMKVAAADMPNVLKALNQIDPSKFTDTESFQKAILGAFGSAANTGVTNQAELLAGKGLSNTYDKVTSAISAGTAQIKDDNGQLAAVLADRENLMEKVANTGSQNAGLQGNIQLNIKDLQKILLNVQNDPFQNMVQGMTRAAGAVMSLSNSLTTVSNLINVMNDSASTGSEKFASLASAGMSVTMTFVQAAAAMKAFGASAMTAGIVGALIAVAGIVGGIIKQIEDSKKKAEKDAAKLALDTNNQNAKVLQEQVAANKTLIESFNALYGTYLQTGEVTDELRNYAQQMADAFGDASAQVDYLNGNLDSLFNRVNQGALDDIDEKMRGIRTAKESAPEQLTKSSTYSLPETAQQTWIEAGLSLAPKNAILYRSDYYGAGGTGFGESFNNLINGRGFQPDHSITQNTFYAVDSNLFTDSKTSATGLRTRTSIDSSMYSPQPGNPFGGGGRMGDLVYLGEGYSVLGDASQVPLNSEVMTKLADSPLAPFLIWSPEYGLILDVNKLTNTENIDQTLAALRWINNPENVGNAKGAISATNNVVGQKLTALLTGFDETNANVGGWLTSNESTAVDLATERLIQSSTPLYSKNTTQEDYDAWEAAQLIWLQGNKDILPFESDEERRAFISETLFSNENMPETVRNFARSSYITTAKTGPIGKLTDSGRALLEKYPTLRPTNLTTEDVELINNASVMGGPAASATMEGLLTDQRVIPAYHTDHRTQALNAANAVKEYKTNETAATTQARFDLLGISENASVLTPEQRQQELNWANYNANGMMMSDNWDRYTGYTASAANWHDLYEAGLAESTEGRTGAEILAAYNTGEQEYQELISHISTQRDAEGKQYLSYDGHDQAWLESDEGQAWLKTREGQIYQKLAEGYTNSSNRPKYFTDLSTMYPEFVGMYTGDGADAQTASYLLGLREKWQTDEVNASSALTEYSQNYWQWNSHRGQYASNALTSIAGFDGKKPTSYSDYANLYNWLSPEGGGIPGLMELSSKELGAMIREKTKTQLHYDSTNWRAGEYYDIADISAAMAMEGFDPNKITPEQMAQWLAEQGLTGEVLSSEQIYAREQQANAAFTQAFSLENADTIERLSQTQSLVSALISDITNLQQGKGLSGQTRSLLEMMGIDPDSIDTVAELKSTINDLLDPDNENSLPAMRATLEASAKEYGIEDFSAVTDEDIAAWSSADATPEQQRKLALYKQWLEYKQKEYELDQSMDEIERQERSQKEQSKISKWKDELTQLNKEAVKTQEAYEALSSSIETGKLTKAQRQSLGAELATAWDQATTAAQRAKVAMAAAYESTAKQQALLDQEAGAAAKFARGRGQLPSTGQAFETYDDAAKVYKANWEDEASFIEKFFGSNLSGAETSVLSQAYQATLNIVPNWTEDPQAFISEFYNQLDILNNDYAEQSNTLMSQLADNINNMYANLGQQEQAAAQAAVQAWTTAFNTIKNVRQALFSDKSAMELIAASPEQAIAMWSQYATSTSGATTAGFLQAARTGKLTANTFQYGDTADYLAAARQQYGIDMVTWSQDGQTYYGSGANYHRSMGRVAEHLGMQYSTTGGNVTWNKGQNGQAGYFTIEGDNTHYSASEILTRAQNGDLTIGADQIGEYITPMWTSALQATGNYTATEATALVMKAMGGDEGAWNELTTALGTVNSGLESFATAVKEAAEVTEHLTDAQTKAEKANREGGQAAKIADALLAFAQDTSGMSWEDFATEQGLTETQWKSINNGNVTRANAWHYANTQYGTANTSYNQATTAYNDYISWLESQGYDENSPEMQNAIQLRDQAAETQASNIGKQKQAARTKIEGINARNQQKREYFNEQYNTASQAKILKDNYADFYNTGVLSPEVKQALMQAGIDPSTITTNAQYKEAMRNLRGNATIYNNNNKKYFAKYAQESGHGTVNFDNVTSTMSYDEWLNSLGVGSDAYIWAMEDSKVKSWFDSYQSGLREAESAQAGLSDSAIEMGVNIERAVAKANKEVDKLDKQYKDIAGLGEQLSANVKTGRLDPAAQAKLAMAGLSTAWGDAKTVQERAKVAARASALEATKQIDIEARRNKGLTGQNGILQFFGSDVNETNQAAAETMAKTFKEKWADALKDTGSSKEAIKNILAMDEFASLSEEAKAKIEEIFSDLNLSDTASPDEFWQAFLDAAEEAGVEAQQVIEGITTSLLSSWQSAMTSIVAEEQAAAQEVVAIWQEAFAIISALHEAAFSGKTLREGLKSVDDYVNAWIQLGATDAEDFARKLDMKGAAAQDLVAAINDPTLTRQATATAYSGLNAFVDWKDDKMVNAEGGAIADLASYKDIVASKIIDIITDKNNPEYAATLAKLGLTDNGDGTFSRTVTDSTGKESTVTFDGKDSLISAYTENEWEQAFAAGQGAADEYYRTEMRRENARRLTAEATGGKLRTAEGEVTTVTLTDRNGKEISYSDLAGLEKGYAAKWESSDADLLEKAIGFTKESDWLSTKEGGKLSEDEIARLKKMGVIDATGAGSTSRAIEAKDNYVADTTVLDQQREWVAAAVKDTLQATDHNTYLDTSRARVLGEGEKAGLGEGTYTAVVDGKEVTYAAPEILESDFEALTETLDTTSEAAQNEIEALSPGVEDALNAAASALGVTRQELGETVEGIYALNDATLDWNSLSKEEQAHAATVAQEWQKQAEALDVLGKALTAKTGAFAVIEDETKSIKEQTAAYETLRDAVNNYFHDNEVGVEFVKQNYEDIKEWANGSLEAMERVEKAVLTQQLDKMLKKQGKAVEDFAKELEELNGIGNNLKFGEKLDKIDMAKLMRIQKALGLTNEEMIALADSMGLALDYEKEMTGQELVDAMGVAEAAQYAADQGMQLAFDQTSQEYVLVNVDADTSAAEEAIDELGGKTVETEEHVSINADQMTIGTETVSASGGTSDSADADIEVDPGGSAHVHKEGEMEMEAETTVPVIESSGGKAQTVKAPQATKTRDNSTPQKSSGGGGGGGQKKQKKKSYSDIKRYHEVDQSLQAYENRINKIAKKEEMAFGADRVKLMKERMKELNKEMDAYQEKLNEATAYEAKDLANLKSAAANLGFTFEFDENGTITNWEKWQETLIDWYNEHKDDEAEDGMESAEDVYKRLTAISEDYEDSVKTRQEMEEKILEQLHAQSELYAEIVQESHQWKLDLQDLKLTLLEGQLTRMDDTLGNMSDKAKLMSEALFGADGVGLEGASMDKLNELLSLQNDIASAKTDEASIANGEGMDEATKAEKLQEVMQQVNEQMNDLWSKGQEIQQLYGDMWSKYDEELQQNADYISNNIALVQTFAKVLELAWRSTNYDALGKFYEKQLNYANKELDLYTASRDTIAAEKARFDEEIVAAGGLEKLDEQRQKDYKDLIARLQEADNNLMQATQDVLEAAAQVYQNAVNKAIKELDSTLAMGLDDLDYLQQQYDRYTETQERYLNTAHQLYNVNKLNRQIEGAMADTNSKALRDQYEALQNVINEKSKSGKLTQYDVDMMQKQYELLEKQAALKDAQNAKDTVRLTRDENGNYMYQYTADQDKIDEATQAYDDVLIQINELSTQRVSELEAEMLEKRKWYVEQARAIAEDETLTEEQKQERLTELRRQAAEDDLYFQEQMGQAYSDLQINNSACVAAFGDAVDQAFNDPTEGINPTIRNAIENEENMADALKTAIDEIIPKLKELGEIQDKTLYRTGLEDPEAYFEGMTESTKLALTETSNLNDALATQAEKINAVTQEWYKQKEALKDLFATIESANTENLQLLWELGNNDSEIADPSSTGVIQYRLVPVRSSANYSTDGHAKGGLVDYTGYHWLDGSITQPELVLNTTDTANMLQTVDMLHNIDVASVQNLLALLSGLAAAMSGGGVSANVANIFSGSGALEQDVHITAEFPNATDKAEIMAAFDELNNRASQYANRNRK